MTDQNADIIFKLDSIAFWQSELKSMQAELQEKITALIPPEIQSQVAELEVQYTKAIERLQGIITSEETAVKTLVIELGYTVQGSAMQAVYSKGRISWDSDKLIGYAAGHPEILPFQKVGKPSVSIKAKETK